MTLYATFDDHQSGVRAVETSLKLARKHWVMIAGAFAGATLFMTPVAGPLYLLVLRIANPEVVTGLTWVIVMAMRPLLIATTHAIYKDFGPAGAHRNFSIGEWPLKNVCRQCVTWWLYSYVLSLRCHYPVGGFPRPLYQ